MPQQPTDNFDEFALSSFITYTNSVDIEEGPSPRLRARNAKYSLLNLLKSYTSLMGIGHCSDVIRIYNPAHLSHERVIRKPCNNRHACPVCTSQYMAKKRNLTERLMKEHRANGGEIFQSVLNQAITSKTKLQVSLPRLNKTWAEMTKNVAWRKLTAKHGLYGYVRLQEEAYRLDTWFPHFHLIWFFEESLNYDQMLEFTLEVADLWAYHSNQLGAIGTSASNQLHETIDQGSEKQLAQYFFKHGFFDLDFDPSEVDLNKHSLTPFNFLIHAFYLGDADLLDQWEDFEQATSGTRRIVPSKNLVAMAKQLPK